MRLLTTYLCVYSLFTLQVSHAQSDEEAADAFGAQEIDCDVSGMSEEEAAEAQARCEAEMSGDTSHTTEYTPAGDWEESNVSGIPSWVSGILAIGVVMADTLGKYKINDIIRKIYLESDSCQI